MLNIIAPFRPITTPAHIPAPMYWPFIQPCLYEPGQIHGHPIRVRVVGDCWKRFLCIWVDAAMLKCEERRDKPTNRRTRRSVWLISVPDSLIFFIEVKFTDSFYSIVHLFLVAGHVTRTCCDRPSVTRSLTLSPFDLVVESPLNWIITVSNSFVHVSF